MHALIQTKRACQCFELLAALAVAELPKLQTEPNRDQLVHWRHAVAGDFGALAVADDDHAVGHQAERTFDGQEDARLPGAEVAVEDVAVVSVNNQRHAADARREATD